MKRSLAALSLIAFVLSLPALVSAQEPGQITFNSLVTAIQGAIWKVFAILALIMFVIAGILFLTAGGDPEKVGTARKAFIWGVVGVVVGIIAYSVVAIIKAFVGV